MSVELPNASATRYHAFVWTEDRAMLGSNPSAGSDLSRKERDADSVFRSPSTKNFRVSSKAINPQSQAARLFIVQQEPSRSRRTKTM
jgi:hypothetical protein